VEVQALVVVAQEEAYLHMEHYLALERNCTFGFDSFPTDCADCVVASATRNRSLQVVAMSMLHLQVLHSVVAVEEARAHPCGGMKHGALACRRQQVLQSLQLAQQRVIWLLGRVE